MRKQKVYIDTSVINYLVSEEYSKEKQEATLTLWNMIRNNQYKAMISTVTMSEIADCPEPKLTFLLNKIREITYEKLEESDETISLTNEYLKYKVLTKKSIDDLRHIAIATVVEADYITSWNFKHFVNIKVMNKVNAVNKMNGYKEIMILPPNMLIEGE
jgi:predicted nucleic acid-binding protein